MAPVQIIRTIQMSECEPENVYSMWLHTTEKDGKPNIVLKAFIYGKWTAIGGSTEISDDILGLLAFDTSFDASFE